MHVGGANDWICDEVDAYHSASRRADGREIQREAQSFFDEQGTSYRTVSISVDAILSASRILTSCSNDDDNNAYNMFSLAQDPQHAAQCGLCFVGQEIIDLPL